MKKIRKFLLTSRQMLPRKFQNFWIRTLRNSNRAMRHCINSRSDAPACPHLIGYLLASVEQLSTCGMHMVRNRQLSDRDQIMMKLCFCWVILQPSRLERNRTLKIILNHHGPQIHKKQHLSGGNAVKNFGCYLLGQYFNNIEIYWNPYYIDW